MQTPAVSWVEFYSGHFNQTKLATVKFADLPKSFLPKWSDCFDMWKQIQSEFLQVNSVRPLWPLWNLKVFVVAKMVWPYRPKYFLRVRKIYLIIWSNHFGQYFFGKVLNFLWPRWSTVGFQVCWVQLSSLLCANSAPQNLGHILIQTQWSFSHDFPQND